MSPRNRRSLQNQIKQLQAELAGLPERPIEPCQGFSDTNVMFPVTVRFHLVLNNVPFTYVACRIKERWWLTGDTGPSNVTWDGLWDWIESQGGLAEGTAMEFATNWQRVRYPTPEPPPDVNLADYDPTRRFK